MAWADARRLAVLARHLGRDDGVRALDLVGDRLADVVQQRRPAGRLLAGAQLGGHDRRQVGALDRVLEHVLAVAGAVVQPAQHLDQLGVQPVHVGLEAGLLAGLRRSAARSRPWTGSTSPRSARDGCGRRRSASRASAVAISRRTPSKADSTTACGVSSMITSTPVRFSRARMLRPSRPMMRPLRSSEGSWTTETVVSAVWPEAVRWIATERMLRARRSASSLRLLLDLAHDLGHVVAGLLLDLRQQRVAGLRRGHPGDPLELGQLLRPWPPSAPPASGARASRGRRSTGRAGPAPRASRDCSSRAITRSSALASSARRSPSSRSCSARCGSSSSRAVHPGLLELGLGTPLGFAEDAGRPDARPRRCGLRPRCARTAKPSNRADDQCGEADQRLLHCHSFCLFARRPAGRGSMSPGAIAPSCASADPAGTTRPAPRAASRVMARPCERHENSCICRRNDVRTEICSATYRNRPVNGDRNQASRSSKERIMSSSKPRRASRPAPADSVAASYGGGPNRRSRMVAAISPSARA